MGKSLFARVMVQYCRDRQLAYVLVEADRSNPDVGEVYSEGCEQAVFSEAERKAYDADRIFDLAIASRGCYPAYSQPSQEQFYSADTIIQVNRGGKTTIEVKPTQLTNQQIHELVTGRSASPGILTFGGVGCEPVAAN